MDGRYKSYPEYKESGVEWFDTVPKDWLVSKIGFLSIKTGSGKTPKGGSEVYSDNGILFLRSQNVYDTGLKLDHDEVVYISERIDSEMKGSRVRGGDILLNITGASIGRSCIVPIGFQKANVNQHVCIIRINETLREYVSLYLKSKSAKAQIDAAQNGAAREGLNFEQLSKILLPLPNTDYECRFIANFLDHETTKIDILIEKQQQLIALLKEKRQAVISHAVTKGLNPDAPMKDSGVEWLGEVPEHWLGPLAMKNISSLKGRLGWQGLKAEEYQDEGPYVVSSAHFNNNQIEWDQCPRVSFKRYDLDGNIQLFEDDILLMKDGAAMGKLAYVDRLPGKACLNSHLLLIRPKRLEDSVYYLPKYMFYFMQTDLFQEFIKVNGTGATFLGISQQAIENYKVVLPPINEQTEIVKYLDREIEIMEDLKNSQKQMDFLLKERRTALISAAVTGKIDVRNWQPPADKAIQ